MTHTLAEIRAEYDRLDALTGADTKDIALRVSGRMSATLGACRYDREKPTEIVISALVMEQVSDELFWDTVRHEYAHALVKLRRPRERHGHDALWRNACREVGCRPEARTKDAAYQAMLNERRRASAAWRLRCDGCGREWYHKRKTKVIRLIERGRGKDCTCPVCKGHSFTVNRLS